MARYKISDLVKDEGKLEYTSAGLKWLVYYKSPAFGEGMFQLVTVDGLRYRFDPNSGAIIEKVSEQGGVDQPATRTELKSEGSQKPQPESEGRSR